jgi:hypothetical protein
MKQGVLTARVEKEKDRSARCGSDEEPPDELPRGRLKAATSRQAM